MNPEEIITANGSIDKGSWVYPIYQASYAEYRREAAYLDNIRTAGFSLLSPWGIEETSNPDIHMTETALMGYATLTNNSDTEQTMKTGEFSKEEVSEWSTAFTDTRDFGMEVEASITFGPSFFQTSFRLQYNMTFSHSTTKTKSGSEKLAYVLPAQEVKVPAHSTRYVYAYLQKGSATGTVNLLMNVKAYYQSFGRWIADNSKRNTSGDIYTLVSGIEPYAPNLDRIKSNPKLQAVTYYEPAKYTVDAAFNVNVEIRDRPFSENGKILQSWTVVPEVSLVPDMENAGEGAVAAL